MNTNDFEKLTSLVHNGSLSRSNRFRSHKLKEIFTPTLELAGLAPTLELAGLVRTFFYAARIMINIYEI